MVIDSLLPEVARRLQSGENLVLTASPGAGKTTRVPPALLAAVRGEILVLEPRRLAARLAARWVAQALGETAGGTVGYQVRFEDVSSPRTRLRYLTEGVLTRRLVSDPGLDRVSVVLLDEFHERHLDTDLALSLLRRLQQSGRPDLRLIVMSATLDAGPVAKFLGGCTHLHAEGKTYPLEVRYKPHGPAPLEEQVAAAAEELVAQGLDGDVLIFLPGAAEIRRAARACEPLARRAGLDVAMLYGDLPPEEQDRAIASGARRKLILSTNLAESSITIEGVSAVIDSGLARVATDSPWTGFPRLQVARVSQASATQRAGRAGRLRAGRVIRLFPAEDFHRRPAQDTPELLRRELSGVALTLRALGIHDWKEVPWLDAPPQASAEAADQLLALLGAADAQGNLTPQGREMARLPLHPRLAALVLEARRLGAGREGVTVAALLSAGARLPDTASAHGESDLFTLIESEWDWRSRQTVEQLRRLVSSPRRSDDPERALREAALAAFPDRVARRRAGADLLLASGGSAVLAAQSAVQRSQFLLAIDVDERPERGLPLVRIASAIEPDWLLDRFPERVTESSRLEWDRAGERVDAVDELRFDQIVIDETRGRTPAPEAAARLLAEKALDAGLQRFADPEAMEAWLARLEFASAHSDLPRFDGSHVRAALESLCRGLRGFRELKEAGSGLVAALEAQLPPGGARALDELSPERIRLPRGRSVKVNYVRGQAPSIASRLQDFFGMTETPRLARGAVPVVVHLLAPNQRPVQMTTDLAGFWERLYPQVRRELGRRYPKHSWPERPDGS